MTFSSFDSVCRFLGISLTGSSKFDEWRNLIDCFLRRLSFSRPQKDSNFPSNSSEGFKLSNCFLTAISN
jgi:hypothetical protein